MMTSRRAALVSLAAVLLATLALSPSIATAKDKPEPLGVPVNCIQLATDPAVGLAGNPVIKAATSTLIPASGVNKAHCRVDVLYGTSPEQNVNIRAGLPLNSLDGGTGGIQGAWNGRTQGVGGGGCAGNVNVTAPVNAGYVGSGTDTGHAGGNCEPGVNEDGTYNLQFIDDPRTCHFSVPANICGALTAPATNCLTPLEARAIDMIWDGPRNQDGQRIWFGLDRGTNLAALNGTTPFFLGVTQFHWDEHDLNFDWRTVSIDKYPQVAQDGSRNIADVTDTFGDLDVFRRHGGKLLTFVGGNDQLIMPRGVINYYRQMASRFGQGAGKGPDFERLQEFYRLFRAPGVGHCGGGSGPQPQNLFDALVNRVENGAAPDQILAQTAGGVVKRPLCPYPQTAIYNGT